MAPYLPFEKDGAVIPLGSRARHTRVNREILPLTSKEMGDYQRTQGGNNVTEQSVAPEYSGATTGPSARDKYKARPCSSASHDPSSL